MTEYEISDTKLGRTIWSPFELPILRREKLEHLGECVVCLFEGREMVITVDRIREKEAENDNQTPRL